MSDDDLPDLPDIPSFEELGISAEELAELEKELAESEEGEEAGVDDGAHSAPLAEAPDGAQLSGAAAGATQAGSSSGTSRQDKSTKPTGGRSPKPTRKERRAQAKADKRAKKAQEEAEAERLKSTTSEPRAAAPRKPLDAPPMGGMRGPFTFVLLLVGVWFASSFRSLPSPVPANAPAEVFSSARAMTHLVQIARAAHPPGSPEHARVREYLIEALADLEMDPAVQTATTVSGRGPFVRTATVRNIVARRPGTASTGAILLTAHYDGREVAQAAGDDGVGVVSILEALRALSAGPALQNDIIVLFTDAEELGLLGARAFVDEHPWMSEVTLVLSFEMRGGGGPAVMFETGAENGWIIEALGAADPAVSANALMYEVYKRMPNDTDFTPFRDAGKQGLNFAAIGRAPVYHQRYDSPENVSEATLQHQGLHALGMIQHLGAADLSSVNGADVSYLSVPVLGLVTYRPWWAYLLSGLIVLVFGLSVGVARRSGATVGGMVAGLVGALLAGALVAGAAIGLLRWLPRFHPEAGQLHGSLIHSEGWYVLVLGFASLAFTLAVFGLLRRWFSIPALAIGAAVLPALGAVAFGFVMPLGAMNLQWPVLAALSAALVISGTARWNRLATLRWVLVAALSVPVLVVLIPLVELLWLAMSFASAPAIGLMLTVSVLLLLPLIEVVREPNGWWAAVTSLVIAAVCLGIGLLTARPDSDRPAPSTLMYTFDRQSGAATWHTDPDSVAGGSTAARDWVTAAIGPVGDPSPLGPFLFLRGESEGPLYATASAPALPEGVPVVALDGDGSDVGGLTRVRIRSEIGAEMVAIDLRQSTAVLSAVNGRRLDLESPARFVEHWGTPEEDLILEFDVPPTSGSFTFALVETHFRPSELVEGDPFDRPPELAPNIRRLSDRAMIRTPIEVDRATGSVTVAGVVSSAPPATDTAGTGVLTPDSVAGNDTAAFDTAAVDTAAVDTIAVAVDTPGGDSTSRDTTSVGTTGVAAGAGVVEAADPILDPDPLFFGSPPPYETPAGLRH